MTAILFEHFHGAVTRVGVTETAVPHRDEGWNLLIPSVWTDPADTEANIAWTRETFAAMRPHFGQRAAGSTTSATIRRRTPSAQPTARTTTGCARSSGGTTRTTSSTSTTTSRRSPKKDRGTLPDVHPLCLHNGGIAFAHEHGHRSLPLVVQHGDHGPFSRGPRKGRFAGGKQPQGTVGPRPSGAAMDSSRPSGLAAARSTFAAANAGRGVHKLSSRWKTTGLQAELRVYRTHTSPGALRLVKASGECNSRRMTGLRVWAGVAAVAICLGTAACGGEVSQPPSPAFGQRRVAGYPRAPRSRGWRSGARVRGAGVGRRRRDSDRARGRQPGRRAGRRCLRRHPPRRPEVGHLHLQRNPEGGRDGPRRWRTWTPAERRASRSPTGSRLGSCQSRCRVRADRTAGSKTSDGRLALRVHPVRG